MWCFHRRDDLYIIYVLSEAASGSGSLIVRACFLTQISVPFCQMFFLVWIKSGVKNTELSVDRVCVECVLAALTLLQLFGRGRVHNVLSINLTPLIHQSQFLSAQLLCCPPCVFLCVFVFQCVLTVWVGMRWWSLCGFFCPSGLMFYSTVQSHTWVLC